MRYGSLSMIAAAAVVMAWPAAAQQPAPGAYKVGIVNVPRVMRDSRVSQQAQKRLEAEFQKREREIAGGPALDIERRGNALAEDMNVRREEALKQFVEKTNGVVRRIAEAEKFDVVFFEAVYASARVDLTDKVIKELDAGR
jgi:outer membrane protein